MARKIRLHMTSELRTAKMLIFHPNGEQQLISFSCTQESVTLAEILAECNVPFSDDTHVQCMQLQNTSSEIDFFVSVGSTTRLEEDVDKSSTR